MKLPISLVLIHCLIHFHQNVNVRANPMFGPNVRDANPGEFPFVASLRFTVMEASGLEDVHACSGVLVTRQDVLTAAHCFQENEYPLASVYIGSHNLTNATRYEILWWINYNQWMMYMGELLEHKINDIGNIRLRDAVPENFNLAVLSTVLNSQIYEMDVVIAAWGRNENDIIPPNLRTVELKVHKMDQCSRIVSRLIRKPFSLHHRFLCTNARPYAIMHSGDSGGPVMLDGMVIAIHKSTAPFADDPHNQRKINIHSNINYYRNFINNVVDSNFFWF